MVGEDLMRRRTNWTVAWRPLIGVVAVALLASGCSSVPDSVNPVKWYESTVDLFSDDDPEADKAAASAQPAPGADREFPNLGTVPERPTVSSRAEREQVAEGLVADREKRRYAPSVETQGAPANVLSDQTASAPAAEAPKPQMAPAPAPVPALPVARTPVSPARPSAAAPSTQQQPGPAPQTMAAAAPPKPQIPMKPPASPAAAATEVAPRMTQPVPPANAMMPSTGSSYETVVVSSSGVDVGETGAAATAPSKAAPAARPQFAAAPPPVGSAAASGALRVATIQFAAGSATLDSRDRSILRQVVALQRERGGILRVVGHASARTANMEPVRHKMVNYEVSADRAQSIAQTLLQLGAPTDRVMVVAKSDSDPVFYEFMPSGEAGNRRAEIYLDF